MSVYLLTWITDSLAVGHAPMSYAELDSIREQGVDAIVNLCGEFCDLHEIEEKTGFEVYFLPIPDESAPDMAEMEKGLQWLDEAIYLGKKVLVHCRHGIGRTGTFVTAYLLRRGLGMKLAEKRLKHTRANPTNFSQWWLLRKYGKKSKKLTIREPSLENRNVVDLGDFFGQYEALVTEIEKTTIAAASEGTGYRRCGIDTDACCRRYFELTLIEAIYLSNRMNRTLTSKERNAAIERAVVANREIRTMVREGLPSSKEDLAARYGTRKLLCPLNVESRCSLADFRPVGCRTHGVEEKVLAHLPIREVLRELSRAVFLALSGCFPGENEFLVSCPDTVSGRFAQVYFHYLASLEPDT